LSKIGVANDVIEKRPYFWEKNSNREKLKNWAIVYPHFSATSVL